MNRDELRKAVQTETPELNRDWVRKLIRKNLMRMLHKHGSHTIQKVICLEELAEMQQEISKSIRGRGDRIGILEEWCDCCIALWTIQEMYHMDVDDLNRIIKIKIKRLEKGLEEEEKNEKDLS